MPPVQSFISLWIFLYTCFINPKGTEISKYNYRCLLFPIYLFPLCVIKLAPLKIHSFWCPRTQGLTHAKQAFSH
jgi:hypothetical protein